MIDGSGSILVSSSIPFRDLQSSLGHGPVTFLKLQLSRSLGPGSCGRFHFLLT